MEQKIDYTSITPPCKMAAKMYMVRLGKILFGLSLIALIVSILPTVSFLMIAAYFLVWVIIVIFSNYWTNLIIHGGSDCYKILLVIYLYIHRNIFSLRPFQ